MTQHEDKKDLLQKRIRLLEAIVEGITDSVFVKDTKGRYVMINTHGAKFLKKSVEEVIGKTDTELFSTDSALQIMKEDRKIMSSKKTKSFEEKITANNITQVYYTTKGPYFDNQGKVIGIIGIAHDVTERKQAEETLNNIAKGVSGVTGEEFFRSLVKYIANTLEVEYAFVGMLEEKNSNRVRTIAIYADGKIVENFEYSLINTPCERVMRDGICCFPSGVQKQFPLDEMLVKMEVESYIGTALTDSKRNNIGIMVVMSRKALTNQKMVESMLQIFAVRVKTELQRIQAEEKILYEKKFSELLINSSVDGILAFDCECRYTVWNKGIEQISGKASKDVVGKCAFDVFPFLKETGEDKFYYEALKGKTLISIDRPYTVPETGQKGYFEGYYSPLIDESGNIIGGIAIIRDITERKSIEDERKKMEEDLLKGQKLESLGIFAGGIAHDFNNLLTGILGNISIARMDTSLKKEVDATLLKAETACMRAKDLTQQLRTFSKGGTPNKKTVSIVDLLKETTSFALSGSSVKPLFIIPENIWFADMDEGQISQVIHNIIRNADEAMYKGGIIKICVENITYDEDGTLSLKKGNYLKVSILDQGEGIPENQLSKIFDPYFTTKESGSGLGLATSYSIIKNHDGLITVESDFGVGTWFNIYLPASRGKIITKKGEDKIPITPKGKILVMDDEEYVRDVAGQMLTKIGHDVEYAKDGSEALELYKKARESGKPFDAVILDLTVRGGMGGEETIKKLLEIDPGVRTIVSSGYSNDPVISNYKQFGFRGILNKPYKIYEVKKIIYEALVLKF